MKKNLLILGASGGVATAFLYCFSQHRGLIDKLILIDKSDKILSRKHIDHEKLAYTFFQQEIKIPKEKEYYRNIIQKYAIDIVLDLTDMDTIPIFEYTNALGVSYMNSAINEDTVDERTIADLVYDIYPRKAKLNNAAHILCAGMNPGVVNLWVRYGIEQYGLPREVIHFEYDTSMTKDKWRSMITWSIHEFLFEAFLDFSGKVLGRGKVEVLRPNGLAHKVNMQPILEPIMKLKKYPYGFQILHEENLSIGEYYNIPSQFIYAIHPKTMKHLVSLFHTKKDITADDITLGENINHPLKGSDSIGVLLKYNDKDVYYFNSIDNKDVKNISATYFQVVTGVYSALLTLLNDNLKNGTYFTEELYETSFPETVFSNLITQEYIFHKNKIIKTNYNVRLQNQLLAR